MASYTIPRHPGPRAYLTESEVASRQPTHGDNEDDTPRPDLVPMPLSPPQLPNEIGRFGQYRVSKLLATGAMGLIFKAEDSILRRTVALKVVRPDQATQEMCKRFVREARVTAAIDHPHLVPIYHAGIEKGLPYLVMPLLGGISLDDWLLRRRRATVPQLIHIGRQICKGLWALHRLGLIHRDIKPANIWLETPNGRVKILDLGLARAADDQPTDDGINVTQMDVPLGSPAYMSPEQASNDPLDARSDLFSLGVVLYQLATGQLPFQGTTLVAMMIEIATHDPTPIADLNPKIPRALATVIEQLLAKDPNNRPAATTAVASAFLRLRQAHSLEAFLADDE